MSPRTGRPKSDNPKDVDIKVRVDSETNQRLIMFAEEHNLTRTEVIRRGIEMVLQKK